MKNYGLLGKELKHSFSPMIHNMLGDYAYKLYEVKEEELQSFMKDNDLDGFNVTIPYKKEVMKYLDDLSDRAKVVGSVNTVVRRPDGTLYGDNTDMPGFLMKLEFAGLEVSGKKALVLGSGGASLAVKAALKELGAKTVTISRSGPDNYENLDKHSDAEIIVNTTPVGMYPDNGKSPLSLSAFKNLKGVVDIIFNPNKTELLLQAEKLGIPYANGLYMLVAQAYESSKQFQQRDIPKQKIREIYNKILKNTMNIVMIGMPGSGKSTLSRKLSERMIRKVVDTDELVLKNTGRTPEEIIKTDGEEAFRRAETEAVMEAGKESGVIIATGGGVVTREENYPLLHQNGIMIYIEREIEKLAISNRPLSERNGVEELFKKREPLYKKWADASVKNNELEQTAESIIEAFNGTIGD